MSKCGTAKGHCCWLGKAGECPYVMQVTRGNFQWACLLRDAHGSWDAVHTSPQYLNNVKLHLTEAGVEQDCGDWPPAGKTCNTCGEVSDG